MTVENLKKLAEDIAYWLDQSGSNYTHKIVAEEGKDGEKASVILRTIDNDEEDLDADDPYISWGCWSASGILIKGAGHAEDEPIVNVNGVIMGAQGKWIAAMFLGSDML